MVGGYLPYRTLGNVKIMTRICPLPLRWLYSNVVCLAPLGERVGDTIITLQPCCVYLKSRYLPYQWLCKSVTGAKRVTVECCHPSESPCGFRSRPAAICWQAC